MTREILLQRAASILHETLISKDCNKEYADAFTDGFYEGCRWADTNPTWHKCPDETPPLDMKDIDRDIEYSRLVLCLTNKGKYVVTRWVKPMRSDGEDTVANWEDGRYKKTIVAWTELPQRPKS